MNDHRVAELAYLEAVRALDGQRSSLDAARSTATAALGITSVGTSFLASSALQRHSGLPALALVAIGGLLINVVAAAVVLWPRKWLFTNEPRTIADDDWQSLSAPEAHTKLAVFMSCHLDKNAKPLRIRWAITRVAIVTAPFSIVCWTLLIGTKTQ